MDTNVSGTQFGLVLGALPPTALHGTDTLALRSPRLPEEERVHVLVNNAAVMRCPHWTTEDGFEMQFGVNYLGEAVGQGLYGVTGVWWAWDMSGVSSGPFMGSVGRSSCTPLGAQWVGSPFIARCSANPLDFHEALGLCLSVLQLVCRHPECSWKC